MTVATPFALRTVKPEKIEANLWLVATSEKYAPYRAYAGDDIPFALWLALTDRRVIRVAGFGIFDGADATWADWFEDGMTPREAARAFLAESEDWPY